MCATILSITLALIAIGTLCIEGYFLREFSPALVSLHDCLGWPVVLGFPFDACQSNPSAGQYGAQLFSYTHSSAGWQVRSHGAGAVLKCVAAGSIIMNS
jgi:hypothetical protein